MSTFCGLHAVIHGKHEQVVHGIADDILARLERMDGLNKPHLTIQNQILAQAYDISAFKIAADELLAEANVHMLFHAFATGAVMASDDRIEAVLVETKSGRFAVRGRMFIDGSGDGDLAAWAGVPYEVGDGAGNMLYPSTMFRINGVDPVKAGRAWELDAEAHGGSRAARPAFSRARNRSFGRSAIRSSGAPISRRSRTRTARPSAASTRASCRTARSKAASSAGTCSSSSRKATPGFEQAYIVEIAPQIGIRETRRVLGEYLLTEADILGCRDFADTIGVQGWPVEAHIKGDVKFVFAPKDSRGFNEIPYRIIVPQKVDNLLVAGRCASMSHEGQSSARVSGPCFIMGQAAGTAADLALQANVAPRALDVAALQRRLRADGANLGPSVG